MKRWLRANKETIGLLLIAMILFGFGYAIKIKHNAAADAWSPGSEGYAPVSVDATTSTNDFGGYASNVSVTQGESVDFHLSGGGSNQVALRVLRDGRTRQLIQDLGTITVGTYDCTNKYVVGCGWPVATSLTIPLDWKSGVYLLEMVPVGKTNKHYIMFWVREKNPGSTARILFLSSVNTHQAYNSFGGGSFYSFASVSSEKVTFDRPYNNLNGTGKYGRWEYKAVNWLEANNYPVEYATTYDLHRNPSLLNPYDVVIIVGHSEYWTWEGRQRLRQYIDNGGRVMMLSGNNMWWQVRYENDARLMVDFKKANTDPIKDRESTTGYPFNHPILDNPIATLGLYFSYAGYIGESFGYYVTNPNHWVFNGTGVANDTLIGKGGTRDKSIQDHETDGTPFNCAVDGRSILGPIGYAGTPPNFTILGISDAHTKGNIDRVTYGMMGIYTTNSGGALFNGGTTGWANGLNDPVISRITKNVLDRFLAGNFPQEPINPDTTYFFYDRFNCYDIGRNRFNTVKWSESIGRFNFLNTNNTGIVALTQACGVDGSGLSLKPSSSKAIVRYPINLRPNWNSTNNLYARFYLNLGNIGLANGGQFNMWELSYHDPAKSTPVRIAEFQVRQQSNVRQVRFQPITSDLPWINIPSSGFVLVETGYNRDSGLVFYQINRIGQTFNLNLADYPAPNKFDLGSMSVIGGYTGNYCIDELILDGNPIDGTNSQPSPPTATSTSTPGPTLTPSSTPVLPDPPTPTPTPTPVPPTTDCYIDPATLIRNAGFDAGTTNWQFNSDVSGNSFKAASNGIFACGQFGQVTLNNTGQNIQLFQSGFVIEKGKKYKLRFDAQSTLPRNIDVYIQMHTSPYTNLGLSQKTVSLTEAWKQYEYTFSATNSTSNGRLRVWMAGLAGGTVVNIDNVSLVVLP